MDLELAGKVVVVSGGSGGIGLACARAFLREGARVGLVGRREDRLRAAAAGLGEGAAVATAAADLSSEVQAERALQQLEAALGPVDVLVNCAGAARHTLPEDLDEAAWRMGMESKYLPVMNMCTVVLRRMRARHAADPGNPTCGAIVNVIGKGGKSPMPTHLPGGAANAALMLATAGLAQAYGSMGVRINAVNPATIVTQRMHDRFALAARGSEHSAQELQQRAAQAVPLGRFGDPAEVADVVLFLASPRARYVLGASVMIDGGLQPVV